MTDAEFDALATRELVSLVAALDGLTLDDLEAELAADVLTIELSGTTPYIVNSHRAARQIWLAAERRAWHFDPLPDGTWVAKKSGDELWATLEHVLRQRVSTPLRLSPPPRN